MRSASANKGFYSKKLNKSTKYIKKLSAHRTRTAAEHEMTKAKPLITYIR